MALSVNERARNYQRRKAAERASWSEEEIAAYRAQKNAAHKAWREANIDHWREIARASAAKQRRARAEAEGRDYGRIGREIKATPEDRAERQGVRRQKKRAYDRANYAKRLPKKLAELAAAYEAAPERIKARVRRYYEANKDKALAWAHARRARLANGGGKFTAEDIRALAKKQKGRCAFCLKPFGAQKPHIDHYVPLALGGSNAPSNLRLLHSRCNAKKRASHPLDFGLRNGLLLW